jgi:signal transduction histidine kinase
MVRSRQRRKPSFLWQALLILFPVGVLAAVGLLSVHRDKILAQHEAVERAQVIAEQLLPRLWSALTNGENAEAFEYHAFQIDNTDELLFPPPLAPAPSAAPLDWRELSPEQAALWQRAQMAEVNNDVPGTIQAIRDFLNTKPPERYAAVGKYDLSSFLIKQGELQNATDVCIFLLDNYPSQISENGLSLQRLAEFKLLELSIMMTNPRPTNALISSDDFCRHIIFDPSLLTSPFLSWITAHAEALEVKDGNDHWNSIWQEHEECRQLYKSARAKLLTDVVTRSAGESGTSSQIFWFNDRGENWLAVGFDEGLESKESMSGNAFPSRKARWKGPKAKMELRPAAGKNYLASPKDVGDPFFKINESRAKGAKTVTLANEPARTDSSEARPIITVSGGRWRNGMSMPDISGPAAIPVMATNPWFLCRTEAETSQALFSLVGVGGHVPDYFGIGIEVAGKRLREGAPDLRIWRELGLFEGSAAKGRKIYLPATATNVLASAFYSGNGKDLLRISVYLTSPATIFRRQSDHTFWFGSLVGISALAAFIGLFSAWRAFHRQQELADMKSNFVSSVSHELRAPIASVRLMAESLERGKIAEAPKQREYFRFISQECRRLSSLIENVLDFSRIEQGRKQYEFEPTDLIALVQQTIKLMEAYGVERQVSIVLKLPDHQASTLDYQLSLDGRAIQQALINLLDNAIKHSPNGQTISVVLESVTDDRRSNHATRNTQHASFVNISVRDNGLGIPPEEHEKIFERFYRLGSELRRETQGVGIGLSIVKHIVEAHSGRVLVQSAPGKGSRFTIELPITNPAPSPLTTD